MGLALLALPASGHAARITFGSDLVPAPDSTASDHADSGYWHTPGVTLPGGGSPTVPEGGQILEIRVKGVALVAPNGTRPDQPSPGYDVPNNLILFQTLKPSPADGGALKVDVTSQRFYLPFGVPEDTVTTFRPENMCAASGDTIDISTIGGWDGTHPGSGGYPAGVPFKIFATRPGASFTRFHGHDRFQNGSPALLNGWQAPPGRTMATPEAESGKELLMQLVVGTGPDAFYMCPGGTNNPYRPPDPPAKPRPAKPGSGGGAGSGPGGSDGSGPGPGIGGSDSGGSSGSAHHVAIAATRLKLNRARRGAIRLRCPATGPRCTGRVTLSYSFQKTVRRRGKARRVTRVAKLGSARFDVAAGGTGAARLKLSTRKLATLRGRRAMGRVVATAVTAPGGPARTHALKVRLSVAKQKAVRSAR